MLFNYNSGLKMVFDRDGAYLPGQLAKIGWKLAPTLNTLSTDPAIEFGQAVKRVVDANGLPYATAIATGDTADKFYGIAVRDVRSQSSVTYTANGTSFIHQYMSGSPISVVRSGYVSVPVQNGTPVIGGKVYVRVTASATNANLPIGGIETAADEGKCVEIPATFESGAYFPMGGSTTTPSATVPTSQCATIFVHLD